MEVIEDKETFLVDLRKLLNDFKDGNSNNDQTIEIPVSLSSSKFM